MTTSAAEQGISKEFVQQEFQQISQEYQLGIDTLKAEQIDVIVSILNGRDTIGILPTGFGKSLVFYVLPFLKAKIIDSLSKVKKSLDGASSGKERIQVMWKRLQELNDCLNPEIADKFALTQEAKTEIILAEEQQLKNIAALLEQVKNMKEFIDSEHIKAAPSFADKISPLATVQLDQKDQTEQHSQEVRELLQAYNDIVTQLSKQFIQWDEVMTKYEVAAQVRKADDC